MSSYSTNQITTVRPFEVPALPEPPFSFQKAGNFSEITIITTVRPFGSPIYFNRVPLFHPRAELANRPPITTVRPFGACDHATGRVPHFSPD